MYNKYFTVEVKPEIDADLLAAGALADDDVIFSWTPFEVPKGSSRLLNVTARVASNDGTAQHVPFQLFFAKNRVDPANGALFNPISIGEFNTTMLSQPSVNEVLGSVKIEAIDYMCQSLVGTTTASTGNSVAANGSNIDMVLTPAGSDHANYTLTHTIPSGDAIYSGIGQPVSITPGYDVLWVAGVACGTIQFGSTVTIDNGDGYGDGATVMHTDTKDANLVFSPGDVVQELGGVGRANTIVGTISSIGEASTADVDITIVRPDKSFSIADGDVLYHRNPIKLELSFER